MAVMNPLLGRRPRLAYPFTVLTGPGVVRLVAGEDHRYSLSGAGLEGWLPGLLERCRGKEAVSALVAALGPAERDAALEVIGQLYSERVLVDGSAADAHLARRHCPVIAGSGDLHNRLKPAGERSEPARSAARLLVLCQDSLDYEQALTHQRDCRRQQMPFLWASIGPLARAYVSPLFLPDAGPCFGCLFGAFQRLSPAPEIYDALREHVRAGKAIEPSEFPAEGLLVLQGLMEWKLREAERDSPSPGLYRLHVLERERFEVSTHRVFIDPDCPLCGKERQ